MKNDNIEAENARLREEIKQVKKGNKSLTKKLEISNLKKSRLQKELKKRRFENRSEQRTITLEPN